MSATGKSSVFVGLVAVVAVSVIVAANALVPPVPGGSTSQSPASTSTPSVDGLRLSLQISSTSIAYGGSLIVNVSETNTNASPLNESASRAWAVQGLRMSACYSSVYPFGVAIYRGHYTSQNVSTGTPLNLYPLVPCPLLLRYISGYYFQPSSDLALILPGSGPGMPMASGVAARGNYTSGNSLSNFSPGEYTVVAGDEWGALALLYFTAT